jgi:hypothetical protein
MKEDESERVNGSSWDNWGIACSIPTFLGLR